MGIQGLLPYLKEIQTQITLDELKGQVIGVDAYVWLHKGAFGCALDLCLDNPTTKYVDYCMKQVRFLKSFGIIPYLVFDGDHLPAKKETDSKRTESKDKKLQMAKDYLKAGNAKKAVECFQQCVHVTPRMAYELIKRENVKFVVAPYEADAQLAFLQKSGLVNAILTEDSDLLVFGCERVIFKLDKEGKAMEIKTRDLPKVKSLRTWDHERFRHMCILSGCDYLNSIHGIGLKTAAQHLQHRDGTSAIQFWIKCAGRQKAPVVPPEYLEKFKMANHTFLYQRVYCPIQQKMVHLNPLEERLESLDFLGPYLL
ncbi:PIN domain-like protein [Gorgonomyces haynaldii]|nr:PIN domain-like protein [Gorgonomyces haynaldii]